MPMQALVMTVNRPRVALLASLTLALASQALAGTLAQSPLTSRLSDPPKPNVMFTIDDSGSMNTQYMPEGTFKIRPTDPDSMRVTFPSGDVTNWTEWYMTDAFPGDNYKDGGWTPACVVPALPLGSENVYQKQFRSPDVNSVYYNPDVRYLPWAQDATTRFGNSTASSARWKPGDTSGGFNLTTAQTNYATNAYYWCSGPATKTTNYGQVCTGSWWNQTCTVPFRRGLVYRLKTATSDPTQSSSYNAYDLNVDGSHAPATKHASRTDCAGTRCTQTEERQNFANWFTYYRSRMLLTKGALSEVIFNSKNNIRVGTASINNSGVLRKAIADLDNAHKATIMTDFRAIAASGGTPLKAAVEAVGNHFTTETPWKVGDKELACRRSYNILTTDGYYNANPAAYNLNTDGSSNTTPRTPVPSNLGSGYGYTARKPFSDSYTDTLADYAMYYYINDLRTGTDNQVTPRTTRTDSPYWQHLTQFTVGIGVTGTLDSRTTLDTDGKTFRSKTLAALTAGTLSWPDPDTYGNSTTAKKIDDLWHAAVNTDGDFFSVKNAPELTAALTTALDSVTAIERKEAGVAASGTEVASGVLKFVPSYQSGAWFGDVAAYEMSLVGGQYTFSTTPKWTASAARPAWASRKIYTWNGTSSVLFDTDLDSTSKALITTDTNLQNKLINYVRGDTSNEGTSASSLRSRNGKAFADFGNSTPLYVKGLLDMGYPASFGSPSYSSFVATKQARTSGVVFAGGNGGMLHAFADSNGAELYAYAPRGMFGNLIKLSQQDYGTASNVHQYFVDGDLKEADAFIPTPRTAGVAAWTNLVLGSYGAGGKGVFALDVTNLSALGATTTLLGERTQLDDADMGHVFFAPEVGRLGGQWLMFYGNGAHSANGRAVLFATNLSTGENLRFPIETTQGNNGLMGVKLLINSSTREVEALYGGDLKGNLWRVDFGPATARSADPATWKIAFNNKPLFVARSTRGSTGELQPITAPPVLAEHYLGGRVVLFGTGQLFDTEDPDDKRMQAMYGVWDTTAEGASAATTDLSAWTSAANQRLGLQQQSIDIRPVTGADRGTYYKSSSNPVNWETQRGWYMDLILESAVDNDTTSNGQRVIYVPQLFGEFVWISTMIPAAAPGDCGTTTGTGYNFLLPAISGAMYDKPVFDTNGDGVVNDQDEVVSGTRKFPADNDDVGLKKEGSDDEFKICNTIDCNDIKVWCIHNGCTVKIKDRIWRQLVEPPKP